MDAIKAAAKTIGTKTKVDKNELSLEEMQEELLRLSRLSPEQAAKELNRYCKYCNALLIPDAQPHPFQPRTTWIFPDTCGCPAEQEALAKQRKLARAVEKQEIEKARLAILKRAGLTGDLAYATFDTFESRQDWPAGDDVKRQVMAYTKEASAGIMPKPVLLLYGQWGAGKSHLAAAVIREGLGHGLRCYFRNWTDYLQRIQASWHSQDDPGTEQEADIINELRQGDIVVIDDLDKRNPTQWVRGMLYPVINFRCNEGLPTVITLNYGPEDVDPNAPGRSILETYFGVASLDRILGKTYKSIEFTGPSYRSGLNWEK